MPYPSYETAQDHLTGRGKEHTETYYGQKMDSRDWAVGQAMNGLVGSFEDVLSYVGQMGKQDFQKQLAMDEWNRKFNSAEASKQRAREEEMSNTSYQRAVADMMAAGINPALAYQQGGASTPSGSSASGSSGSGRSGNEFTRMTTALLSTAVAAAGSVAGKAIGSKVASSAAAGKVANEMSKEIVDTIPKSKNYHTFNPDVGNYYEAVKDRASSYRSTAYNPYH